MQTANASRSGTFSIGGDLPVHRMGLGAMRITGPGIWGPPKHKGDALAVLRRAVELGVHLIDTAESYGPHVSEQLIAEALHPYPKDLVIATKGGYDRTGPDRWVVNGRPERLKEELMGSLGRLRVECIDLWQLHRVDPEVPEDEQFAAIAEFRQKGWIRHVGLSEATVEQIESARRWFPVVTVQNRYNFAEREWEPVLEHCERENIGFLPWYPLESGKLAGGNGEAGRVAKKRGATAAQVALAWLLRRSPVMLPIPGTSSVEHLEENLAAASLELTDEEYEAIGRR